MSGLCALGHREGSKGCFVLTNLKANNGGAHHIGQYMQLTDGKHVGLLSTNILQILSDLPFRIGVRVRVTVTAKVLPGHCGTNFFVVRTFDSFLFKSTQHPFVIWTLDMHGLFWKYNNNKASGVKSF